MAPGTARCINWTLTMGNFSFSTESCFWERGTIIRSFSYWILWLTKFILPWFIRFTIMLILSLTDIQYYWGKLWYIAPLYHYVGVNVDLYRYFVPFLNSICIAYLYQCLWYKRYKIYYWKLDIYIYMLVPIREKSSYRYGTP